MLTKQRQELILQLLKEQGSVTVAEIRDYLDISESTVRRDITALDQEGKLVKVFGGAVAVPQAVTTQEYTVAQKEELNREEKERIAKYAASFVKTGDFIYIDAGTTTAGMLDHLTTKGVTFVTNAVSHARYLAGRDCKVILLGGELKASTEAVIGSRAVQALQHYHFTKGFFGTNGVTKQTGCTTPDENEALVKRTAMEQCRTCYVLCDSSKFGNISAVTFSSFDVPVFLTDRMISGYEDCKNLIVAEE